MRTCLPSCYNAISITSSSNSTQKIVYYVYINAMMDAFNQLLFSFLLSLMVKLVSSRTRFTYLFVEYNLLLKLRELEIIY